MGTRIVTQKSKAQPQGLDVAQCKDDKIFWKGTASRRRRRQREQFLEVLYVEKDMFCSQKESVRW